MLIKEIDDKKYQEFAYNHKNAYYMNSSYAINCKKANNWDIKYLGYFDENRMVAAVGMYYVPLMHFFKYAYAVRGFLIDYDDEALLTSFTNDLKKYLKKEKVVYLRIDPYVIYRVLNEDGSYTGCECADEPVNNLIDNGYEHMGFTAGLIPDTQVRYMMRLDLKGKSKEDLLNNMHKMNKRNISKAQKAGVEIERLQSNDLEEFIRIMSLTSDKNHLESLSKNSYINQMNNFKNKAYALISKINLDKYISKADVEIKNIDREYSELIDKKENMSEKKFKKREKELITARKVEEEKKDYAEKIIAETGKHVINLSAGYFIDYADEICYIAGGSDDKYTKFCGPFLVQWYMIEKALEENKKYYNFTGTSGDFSESSSDYGVYMFKRRFGGYPIELIGEFKLPIRGCIYKLGKILSKI